jgi:hypothetical protein
VVAALDPVVDALDHFPPTASALGGHRGCPPGPRRRSPGPGPPGGSKFSCGRSPRSTPGGFRGGLKNEAGRRP